MKSLSLSTVKLVTHSPSSQRKHFVEVHNSEPWECLLPSYAQLFSSDKISFILLSSSAVPTNCKNLSDAAQQSSFPGMIVLTSLLKIMGMGSATSSAPAPIPDLKLKVIIISKNGKNALHAVRCHDNHIRIATSLSSPSCSLHGPTASGTMGEGRVAETSNLTFLVE